MSVNPHCYVTVNPYVRASVKIGPYEYKKSTRADKKLMVTVDGKTIHFGSKSMEHYHDKTGIWKHLNHKDKQRREHYLSRSNGIKDKNGNLTKDNPNMANFHSRNILW